MNKNEFTSNSEIANDVSQKTDRKTIYDGIKITKRGADILITVILITLITVFTFALLRS